MMFARNLEPRNAAILEIFCSVWDLLLSQLELIDEIASEEIESIDCYEVVRNCFEPSLREFGCNAPDTHDSQALIEDLLIKLGGQFDFKYSRNPHLRAYFREFRELLLASFKNDPIKRIAEYHDHGKALSEKCYLDFCGEDYSGCGRHSDLIIKFDTVQISCLPDKCGGDSRVYFGFLSDKFDFTTYVNLPFYFFHEYLSHMHSAQMFGDQEADSRAYFEDGWLLHFAYYKYPQLCGTIDRLKPLFVHLSHYLTKYIILIANGDEGSAYVKKGYEIAQQFRQIVGDELFSKVSMVIASHPYDCLVNCADLHADFTIAVHRWLGRYRRLDSSEQKECVEFIELALEEAQSIRTLFEAINL